MISAAACKLCNIIDIDDYCTKKIQPLLLESKGSPIYFGKYSKSGNTEYYISATYAKDVPSLKPYPNNNHVHPSTIADYLKSLGYKAEWVCVEEPYKAGYSSTKRTCYYPAGSNIYYSLKISV